MARLCAAWLLFAGCAPYDTAVDTNEGVKKVPDHEPPPDALVQQPHSPWPLPPWKVTEQDMDANDLEDHLGQTAILGAKCHVVPNGSTLSATARETQESLVMRLDPEDPFAPTRLEILLAGQSLWSGVWSFPTHAFYIGAVHYHDLDGDGSGDWLFQTARVGLGGRRVASMGFYGAVLGSGDKRRVVEAVTFLEGKRPIIEDVNHDGVMEFRSLRLWDASFGETTDRDYFVCKLFSFAEFREQQMADVTRKTTGKDVLCGADGGETCTSAWNEVISDSSPWTIPNIREDHLLGANDPPHGSAKP